MAAQRAALLRTLEAEGLLGRNAGLPVPEVTLHVGLVASPGTEGYRDFLGQLTARASASASRSSRCGCRAPARRGHRPRPACSSRSDCDVIAVVRGGGARADLAAFETELVARAVAGRPSRSAPASATPATRPWPTSWPPGPASRPPSAGTQIVVRDPPVVGGARGGAGRVLARRVPPSWPTPQARDTQARAA